MEGSKARGAALDDKRKDWQKHMSQTIYGYARVSTRSQYEDRQMLSLNSRFEILPENIFVDKQSGSHFERPAYMLSLIHISEPTRQAEISYAVFCLKKKKQKQESWSTRDTSKQREKQTKERRWAR